MIFPLPAPKEKWFIKRKRETVYYLSMEVLRNLCMQIDSSPTHVYVKTAVLFLHTMKISQVSNYKISITLLLILTCLGKSFLNPLAKIHNLIDNREYRTANN